MIASPHKRTPRPLSKTVRVAVHGADTPSGRELANLLRFHPRVSSAHEIACDGSILVGWDGAAEPCWSERSGREIDADVVFVCMPADAAAPVLERSREAGARVIDLSGCLNPAAPGAEPPLDPSEVVYGLPEFASSELRTADQVANADSLATCATIALGPAAMAGLLGPRVEVETTQGLSKQSPTGARTARGELQENLRELHRSPREPHLVLNRRVDPTHRGVLAKTVVEHEELTPERVHTLYETFYADTPCVEVLPQGLPALPAAPTTSKVQVAVGATEQGDVEIACKLDDALKGSLGQAIRNMNLMCGFPETLGLPDVELPLPTEPLKRVARRPDL